MDRKAAQTLIEQTFNYPFDEGRFRYFSANLLNDVDEGIASPYLHGQYIENTFKQHIKKYKRIGTYIDPEGDILDVLVVHLLNPWALERSRTMLRNFTASYLKNQDEKDAALVAYHTDDLDDWRFSFVRMEYRQEITEKGTIKVKEEFTPARRYSYLVGKNEPNHTAQEQLIPILEDDQDNPTLADIEAAFSVDAVTKQFYKDYRVLFEKLTKELNNILEKDNKIKKEFEDKSIDTANFSKKLMGQIVFLYFLQKKGWLGVSKDNQGNFKRWGTGPKNFMKCLFHREFSDYKNFFNDILEPLFYNALNNGDRRSDYYEKLDCKIPFLDGGLFEPMNDYDWVETEIRINNDIFKDILKTFDRYNFTVREDEPLDKEVAVDPEMLGKVFENLLPENIRKGKGAFYTPRTIVHYMCQESLINYLVTECGEIAQKEDIELLIQKGESIKEYEEKRIEETIRKEDYQSGYKNVRVPNCIKENANLIDEKLAEIKICDPAIGSGAFPVGMMNEIVKARSALDTYLKTGKSLYDFKRHCIQNSLYGVDIDPGAIDIAKLRLWLSLVVDEEDYHSIQPLPNLEYKIMQGNSLIEEFHGILLDLDKKKDTRDKLFVQNDELDSLITSLHEKQNRYLNEAHPKAKKKLKIEVGKAIVDIFHYELQRQKKDYSTGWSRIKRIAESLHDNIRDQYVEEEKVKFGKQFKDFDFETIEKELSEMSHGNKVRKFFPWKLYFADVFREKGGFDVVIANPPYVSHDKIREKEYLKQRYKSYQPFADLFCYFLELAVNIQKNAGLLCFITSNSYLKADYGLPLRRVLKDKNDMIQLINIEDYQIFESSIVNSAILISQNKAINIDKKCMVVNTSLSDKVDFNTYIDRNKFYYSQSDFSVNSWSLVKKHQLLIQRKIDNSGPTLEKMGVKIKLGIATGANYAFLINESERKRLIDKNNHNREIIKPIIRGRDIYSYYYKNSGLYILLTKNGINVKSEYPDIYEYLNSFGDKLKKRGARGEHWTNLRACSFYDDFKKDKIVWIELTDKGRFALCSEEIYLINTAYFLLAPTNLDQKYLLSLLNSKLIQFYLNIIAGTSGMGTSRWINTYVKNFPIPEIRKEKQQLFTDIVNKIITQKKSNHKTDTSKMREKIDKMVYRLYGLTDEEITIVEESVGK